MPTGIYVRTKPVWNKGKKNPPQCGFQKGNKLGIKLTSQLVKELWKDVKFRELDRWSDERREKKRQEFLGKKEDQSIRWAGDEVEYRGLHHWKVRQSGKPSQCEHCGLDGLVGHQIHWANKSGEYKRELTDWIRLCAKCHKQYDLGRKLPSLIIQDTQAIKV